MVPAAAETYAVARGKRYDPAVSLTSWLRGLFTSTNPDEEAAAGEEYGLRDPGDADLDRQRLGSRPAPTEGAAAAEDDLDSLSPPPDRSP